MKVYTEKTGLVDLADPASDQMMDLVRAIIATVGAVDCTVSNDGCLVGNFSGQLLAEAEKKGFYGIDVYD